jgi:hypothetical protein
MRAIALASFATEAPRSNHPAFDVCIACKLVYLVALPLFWVSVICVAVHLAR